MYLTPRERQLAKAQLEGYNAWPHGTMPEHYEDYPANKEAWNAGYRKAQQEHQDYFNWS